ncbi:MAG: hypothetical protein LBF17_03410 [Mediterranea sp.]|jgi:hypothetical protein|nr:hypothetical protein [Mediterranea sp.]
MTYPVVTTCKGFSKVSGGITPDGFFNLISHSAYERQVGKINRLVGEGKIQEAGNVKGYTYTGKTKKAAKRKGE